MLAGALALSASPLLGLEAASAADALPPLADPIADGAFCDGAPATNPFTDLGAETTPTRTTILCLVATELTSGTTATTYTPGGTVTRRQMALFVKRLADLLDDLETGNPPLKALPTYDGSSDFSDVPADDVAASAIGQLSQAGIVGGLGNGTFGPGQPVSRRQMAAFVNRLQGYIGGTAFSTDKDYFTDDEGDSGEANLNALAGLGIFQGDGQGHVFPGATLTRRQMANILLRYAQVYYGLEVIESPFGLASNASFAVTPTALATQHVSGEPNADDDRQYTATGLQAGTTYVIQLFPAANVDRGAKVTFTEDGSTNTADEGAVAADVTVVNGTNVVGADDDATAQPVGGQITFTIDGVSTETVVPVVYKDADADGNLDLNADNTPVAAEPFGVGGPTRYLPAEAVIGASAITVTSVTAERDAFISGGATYFYDSNDTYKYQGVGISRTQFDSLLSAGDTGTANYNPDAAGVSVFDISGDDVDAPATPSLAIVNGDAGPTANDARITYTRPATNSPGVAYTLQRSVVDDGVDNDCGSLDDTAGAFATVAAATQVAGTGAGVFVFSDNNVANGCYTYRIRATSPVSGNTADSAAPAAAIVPAPPDATAPLATFTKRTTDAGQVAFDAGDVIKIVFDEPMKAPIAGASLSLTDGDLTFADIISGTNATFALNAAAEIVDAVSRPAGTVLTITLTAAPTVGLFPGLTPGLQAPATIQDRSGITDLAGNAWNLTGSDVTIDSV
jgi:hypothetical protein